MEHLADDDLEAWSRQQLAHSECARVEEHLLICEVCQARVEAMEEYARALRTALENLKAGGPPAGRTRE